MKIKILKTELVKNIQNIQNVISSRSNLPILSNVLIEAEKNNIKLTSTDLDIGIISRFASEVDEVGAITIPAKRFSDIVKELPDEDILINTLKNNSMTIKCGKCFFKILGLPKEDFPKLPEFKDEPHIMIEQGVFKKMLAMTHFSISHDETRYVLNGALFLFKKNHLIIVATDGKRLSFIKRDIGKNVQNRSIIVPLKAIYELNRVLKDEGFNVILAENGNKAIKVACEESPDLVLLDIWMPEIDGIETLKKLKAERPQLQVIMMSGHGTIETAVQSTKLGAYDFIEKPLSRSEEHTSELQSH